jgi:hypothetical protein
MSDTPRTDARIKELEERKFALMGYQASLGDFARTLERENTKLRAVMKEMAELLAQPYCCVGGDMNRPYSGVKQALTNYNEVYEQQRKGKQ